MRRKGGLVGSAVLFFLSSLLGLEQHLACPAYYEGVRSAALEPERLNAAGLVLGIWSAQPMSADGSSCLANGFIPAGGVCTPM